MRARGGLELGRDEAGVAEAEDAREGAGREGRASLVGHLAEELRAHRERPQRHALLRHPARHLARAVPDAEEAAVAAVAARELRLGFGFGFG